MLPTLPLPPLLLLPLLPLLLLLPSKLLLLPLLPLLLLMTTVLRERFNQLSGTHAPPGRCHPPTDPLPPCLPSLAPFPTGRDALGLGSSIAHPKESEEWKQLSMDGKFEFFAPIWRVMVSWQAGHAVCAHEGLHNSSLVLQRGDYRGR